MGRKKKSHIYEFYDYDENAHTSKCLIEGCSAKIKGKHGANLLRHFQYKHKQEFEKIRESNKVNLSESNKTDALNNKEIVTKNLINLVTIHGRANGPNVNTLLEDEAFQKIINLIPMVEKTSVNAHKIRELVQERAYQRDEDIDTPSDNSEPEITSAFPHYSTQSKNCKKAPKRKREDVYAPPALDPLEAACANVEASGSSKTEFDIFCEGVALQLNSMPLEEALQLQLELQTLVTQNRLQSLQRLKTSQTLPKGEPSSSCGSPV